MAKDAKTLSELAHLHRMHTDEKVDAQTDAIRDFCTDVEENHAQALANVGGEVLFAKLKAANQAVCDAMMRRFQLESERELGAMVSARRATDNAYRGLAHCVEAMVYMQGLEPYAGYISFVNQLLKHYKRLYPSSATGTGGGSDVVGGSGEGEGEETPSSPSTPSTPGTPGEPGNGGSSSGGGSSSEEKFTVAWYLPNGNPIVWYELAPGEVIPEAPQCPEGYYWHPYPSVMPNHDLDIIPEPIQA